MKDGWKLNCVTSDNLVDPWLQERYIFQAYLCQPKNTSEAAGEQEGTRRLFPGTLRQEFDVPPQN